MITVTGPLKIWAEADGRWHFMNVPEELCGEIRAQALPTRRGFGSVRVEVSIDAVTWRTSVFPMKSGGYFLPVKMDVVRKADLAAGEAITVRLEIL